MGGIKNILLLVIFFISLEALSQTLTAEQEDGKVLFKQGVDLAFKGEYEESLVLFDKAIVKFPKLVSAYYLKSKVLTTLKKYEEAIKVCDEALALKAEQPLIIAQKALCLYILQRYKDSLEVAELAVQYGTNISKSYKMRGNARGALGKYELAIEDYNMVLELDSENKNNTNDETYLNRFCPLYQLKRYDEALTTCNKALEITNDVSKLPQIYSKKALVLNKLGQHKEALENAEKALKIDAQDPLGISEKKTAESKLKKGFI